MTISQIIAIGGGGFSMEAENSPIDRYILAQTGKPTPRVAFLPTASADSDNYIMRFYAAFSGYSCRPSHLKLFERTPDLAEFLQKQDVIYVGGGNTRSMLAVWREWGIPELLRQAWQAGVVMAGLSAGAICWFQQGLTDSWAGELRPLDCMGFLKMSCCPHYDSEPDREPTYRALVSQAAILPGYALDDLAAAHFHGEDLHRAVASQSGAQAYFVESAGGEAVQKPLPLTVLDA